MKVDIKDINAGDYIFIGSRWHRISRVQRAGDTYVVRDYNYGYGYSTEPKLVTKTYVEDDIKISCTYSNYLKPYDVKNGGYKDRPLPEVGFVQPADAAFPKCKFCEGQVKDPSNGGKPRGNYILLSEIMDIEEVAKRVMKKMDKKSGYYWREPRFRIVDDRKKEE